MKKHISVLVFLLALHNLSIGQTLQDTKDYVSEKIDAYDPIPNYDNFTFFQNIIPVDASELAGKKLSEEELKNLFIYGRECHTQDNKSSGVWLTVAEVIDMRGITKVSTTKFTNKYTYYSINVYLSGEYYAKKYSKTASGQPEHKSLDKMEILVNCSSEIAEKIKTAIIHLGKLSGATVKDGDIF